MSREPTAGTADRPGEPGRVAILRPGRVAPTAAIALGVTLICLALALAGRITNRDAEAFRTGLVQFDSFYITAAIAAPVLGLLILRRLPRNAVGWLLLGTGTVSAIVVWVTSWPSVTLLTWVAQWLPWVPIALLPMPLLVFPDGQLPSPRWMPLIWLGIMTAALPALLLAAAALIEPRTLLELDVEHDPAATALLRAALGIGLPALLASTLGGLAALGRRWQQATGAARGQIRQLGIGAAVVPVALAAELVWPGPWIAAALAIPVAMTIAILSHGLYDIDLFINRSAVYAVLTVLVFSVYSVIVRLLEAAFNTAAGESTLVAAGLVAAAFEPVRERVQRTINHLIYGDRNDPYAVVTRLGERLEAVLHADAVLPGVVQTVTDALRVPYAEIRIARDGEMVTATRAGRLAVEPVVYPLTHDGAATGELRVAPRSPSQPFNDAEHRLLADLARLTGNAVIAVHDHHELRRTVERMRSDHHEVMVRWRHDLEALQAQLHGLLARVETESQRSQGNAAFLVPLVVRLQGIMSAVSQLRMAAEQVDDLQSAHPL